ncbi:MAG: hypothetical protein STHCBS139747_005071 [Sporothrix thermara]
MSTSKASSESAKSSLGKRRRLGNDDGDDSDNDNGSGGGEPRGKLTSRTHQPRAPSPLQHHESSVPYEEETKGQGCAGAAPPPTHVYRALSELQGLVIPVYLGLIKLDMEYPMVQGYAAGDAHQL